MAKLTLNFNVPDSTSYDITVENNKNKIEKTIDVTRKKLDLNLEGEVKIQIRQVFEPMAESFLLSVLRVLTMPFYGIYVMLFQGNDSDWEKDVCPFGIDSLLSLHVTEDAEYTIDLVNSTFDAEKESFTFPKVVTTPSVLTKNEKTENSVDIEKKYKRFIRKSYSAFSIILVLCAVVFYNGIFGNGNTMTTVIVDVVTLAMFLATQWRNERQKQKRNYLYEIYNKITKE